MTRTSKRTEGTTLVRDPDGRVHNLCQLCEAPVRYPDGVHMRGGREVHVACYRTARDPRDMTPGRFPLAPALVTP